VIEVDSPRQLLSTRGHPVADGPEFQKFSTRAIPQAERFDCWMSVLNDSMWRVTDWKDIPRDFNVDLSSAKLGNLTTLSESISQHHSRRTRADLDKSGERSCHLFVSTEPAWGFVHRGVSGRLNSGDVLMFAEGEHETICPHGFRGVVLKCPEDWVRTWVPDPDAIAGRTFARDSKWGRVLSPIIRQMTPEFALAPPLPHGVLVDQLGAMLGLLAGDADSQSMPDLVIRIRACIRERCGEASLTADDVARSINIPVRVIHRTLSTAGSSFAADLIAARVEIAESMLNSRSCKRMGLAEIAQACGFSGVAHFTRVLRKRSAANLSRSSHPTE